MGGLLQLTDPPLETARTSAQLAVFDHPAFLVTDAAASPDGRLIATTAEDGAVRIFEVATGSLRRTLESGAKKVLCVAWTPDGSRLAAGVETAVRVFDVSNGAVLHTLLPPNPEPESGGPVKPKKKPAFNDGWVMAVAWGPDGRRLATAAIGADAVRAWNLDDNYATQSPRTLWRGSEVEEIAWALPILKVWKGRRRRPMKYSVCPFIQN